MCEFLPVIEVIFNNWSALKLCVDHGMGGDPVTTVGKLRNFVEAVHTALSSSCDFYDLVDVLEDTLDSDFHTELQDGSSAEVATVIHELYKGWHEGKKDGVLKQIRLMPQPYSIFDEPPKKPETSASTSDEHGRQRRPRPSIAASRKRPPPPPPVDTGDEPMSQDNPGTEPDAWTVVTRKK